MLKPNQKLTLCLKARSWTAQRLNPTARDLARRCRRPAVISSAAARGRPRKLFLYSAIRRNEFENLDKAQAWLKSSGRKGLAPKRTKAIKLTRQFIFEWK